MLTRYLLDSAAWALAGLVAGMLLRPWLDGRVLRGRKVMTKGRRR